MIELSVVIPIRNEAPSLDELHRELTGTLDAWGRPYEIMRLMMAAPTPASRFWRACTAPIRGSA